MAGPSYERYVFGSFSLAGQFWWNIDGTIAVLPADFPVALRNNPRQFVAEWQNDPTTPILAINYGEYAYQQIEGWTVVGMWDAGGGSTVAGSCLVFAYRGLLPRAAILQSIAALQFFNQTTDLSIFKRADGAGTSVSLLWAPDDVLPDGTVLPLNGIANSEKLTTKYKNNIGYGLQPVRTFTFTLATNRSIAINVSITSHRTFPSTLYYPVGVNVRIYNGTMTPIYGLSGFHTVNYVNTNLAADTYTVEIRGDNGESSLQGTGVFSITGTDNGPGIVPVILPGDPLNPIPIAVNGPDQTYTTTLTQFPMGALRPGTYGVFYTFNVPLGTLHTITCGPNLLQVPSVSDTYLYLFSGTTYTGQFPLAQDDDSGGGIGTFPNSRVISVLGPGNYVIATCGFGAPVGGIRARVTSP